MRRLVFHLTVLMAVIPVACTPRPQVNAPTVSEAWQTRAARDTASGGTPSESASSSSAATGSERSRRAGAQPGAAGLQSGAAGPQMPITATERPREGTAWGDGPIATVNGHPIARRRMVDLLLRSKGVGLLEQLIVLDAAERRAAERGLSVTQTDLDREYDRTLRRLVDPLASVTPQSFDRGQAERVLEAVLLQREVSREEFLLGVRRNAFLRRIVESEQKFTDQELRAEFERVYGRRARVRHIQLATSAEVSRIHERLSAGAEFGELARRYSANIASAQVGGLLEPFSANDEQVPALLRDVAFGLEPGEVSGAVRIGDWYHFVRLEALLSPEAVDFEQVRDEVELRLRARRTEPAMGELYQTLFNEADIRIHDPVLREAFEQRHPDHAPQVPVEQVEPP